MPARAVTPRHSGVHRPAWRPAPAARCPPTWRRAELLRHAAHRRIAAAGEGRHRRRGRRAAPGAAGGQASVVRQPPAAPAPAQPERRGRWRRCHRHCSPGRNTATLAAPRTTTVPPDQGNRGHPGPASNTCRDSGDLAGATSPPTPARHVVRGGATLAPAENLRGSWPPGSVPTRLGPASPRVPHAGLKPTALRIDINSHVPWPPVSGISYPSTSRGTHAFSVTRKLGAPVGVSARTEPRAVDIIALPGR